MKYESFTDKKVWRRGAAYLKKRDKKLAKIINDLGYHQEIKLHTKHYDAIIHSIIYQQISGAAGNSILKKFKTLYKGKLPTPKQFLRTPEKRVRSAGISPQKYSYIKDLCEKLEDGSLELKKFRTMPDAKIIEELDAVRGIGRWTAEMFLMFSLGRVDILPMEDLGIRKAIQHVYKMKRLPEREDTIELEKRWKPYNSIAALYLWRHHDIK